MPLSGLERASVRPRGGVARVELLPAANLYDVNLDPATGRIIAYGYSAVATEYVFCEDRAEYSETPAGDGQQLLVRHTLVMVFPAGKDTLSAVNEISEQSREGLVAFVTTFAGEKFLVGWSYRFAKGYPLRVAALACSSERSPADLPSVTLTLESTDADRSLPFV